VKEDILADRYAKALTAVAAQRNLEARLRDELALLADILMPDRGEIQVPELLALLSRPRIPLEDKKRVAGRLHRELALSDEVGAFFNLLIRRGRVGLIGRIAERFRERIDRAQGVASADAQTARPLSEEERRRVEQALAEVCGRPVDLTVRTNPALIAGLRVRVGGRQIDGSVAGALAALQTRMIR